MPIINLTQTPFNSLGMHLLDLLKELDGYDIPLILVGGFGLFLRRECQLSSGAKTIYSPVPNTRSTEDFDALLKLNVLADVPKMQALRDALSHLNYEVIKGAEKYQFIKLGTEENGRRSVKVDLLARKPEADDPQLTHDSRRIGPLRKNNPVHAHVTPEAIAVEEGLLRVTLNGYCTSGESYAGDVFLANPYALCLMKLFAFRDEEEEKKGEGRQAYARKHAQDIATIIALLTEAEYSRLSDYQVMFANHVIVQEANDIVYRYFSASEQAGLLRLREAGIPEELRQLTSQILVEIFQNTEQ